MMGAEPFVPLQEPRRPRRYYSAGSWYLGQGADRARIGLLQAGIGFDRLEKGQDTARVKLRDSKANTNQSRLPGARGAESSAIPASASRPSQSQSIVVIAASCGSWADLQVTAQVFTTSMRPWICHVTISFTLM